MDSVDRQHVLQAISHIGAETTSLCPNGHARPQLTMTSKSIGAGKVTRTRWTRVPTLLMHGLDMASQISSAREDLSALSTGVTNG